MTTHRLPDESVTLELGHSDIAVYPIFPGLVDTALARHGHHHALFAVTCLLRLRDLLNN